MTFLARVPSHESLAVINRLDQLLSAYLCICEYISGHVQQSGARGRQAVGPDGPAGAPETPGALAELRLAAGETPHVRALAEDIHALEGSYV